MNKWLIILIAFIEGALFMACELISSQLLQPMYGSSYFVWISVIGVAMFSSALGYFLGSYLCKRLDDQRVWFALATIPFFFSLYIICDYYIFNAFFPTLVEFDTLLATLFHGVFLMLLPIMLVTSMSPMIIKLLDATEHFSGRSAGVVFASSTMGGVITVYVAAFYIIPEFGIKVAIITFGLLAILTSVLVFLKDRRFVFVGIVFLIGFFTINHLKNNDLDKTAKNNRTVILERSFGVLGELLVSDTDGYERYLMVNRMIQSGVNLKQGVSILSYPYRISMYASKYPEGSKVLIAGLGGGTLINHFIEFGFDVEAVDIDPRMYYFGKKYLGLREDFKFVVDDFRHYLYQTKKQYEVIVVDLSKAGSIPANVFTKESFKQIKSKLTDDGIIIIHYSMNDHENNSYNSVLKTLRSAGLNLGVLKKKVLTYPEKIIVASNSDRFFPENDFRMPESVIKMLKFPTEDYLEIPEIKESEGVVLTDDNSYLEKLQYEEVMRVRNSTREILSHQYFRKSGKSK